MSLSDEIKKMYEMWFLSKNVKPTMQCCIQKYGRETVVKEMKRTGFYIFLRDYVPKKEKS